MWTSNPAPQLPPAVSGHDSSPGIAALAISATGHTGRFVVQELLRRGYSLRLVARDGEKLAEPADGCGGQVSWHVGSLDEPASLERAFDGVAAVVNCAGPFLDTTAAVAAAALQNGAHYVDVTAEQPAVLEDQHLSQSRALARPRGPGHAAADRRGRERPLGA